MRFNRPGAATAAGIMAIIYGALFTFCGAIGLVTQAAQGAGNNFFGGNDPAQVKMQKDLEAAIARDVPGYAAYQVGSALLGLLEALALLIAGINILNLRVWARKLALLAALIAVASTVFQIIYTAVYLLPALSRGLQAAMPQGAGLQAQEAAKVISIAMTFGNIVQIAVGVLVIIYLLIIVMLLCRRHVVAAFATGGLDLSDDRRDEDDDDRRRRRLEEDDDSYEPRQARDRAHDAEDDGGRDDDDGSFEDRGKRR
jgi:hypothetical protein